MNAIIKIPEQCFAMTQEEIAREIGTTRKNVAMTQQRALRKLRARPLAFVRMLELAAELNRNRERGARP